MHVCLNECLCVYAWLCHVVSWAFYMRVYALYWPCESTLFVFADVLACDQSYRLLFFVTLFSAFFLLLRFSLHYDEIWHASISNIVSFPALLKTLSQSWSTPDIVQSSHRQGDVEDNADEVDNPAEYKPLFVKSKAHGQSCSSHSVSMWCNFLIAYVSKFAFLYCISVHPYFMFIWLHMDATRSSKNSHLFFPVLFTYWPYSILTYFRWPHSSLALIVCILSNHIWSWECNFRMATKHHIS